jgi:hypothetical protein
VEEPLSAFLFEHPAGHCEYFATALAVLARSRGIPTRLVNGFVGGQHDAGSGLWTVRRKDAHTWVEAYDRGWWRIDPTPGPAAAHALTMRTVPIDTRLRTAWNDQIVDFDRADQVRALWSAARIGERVLPFTTSRGPPWQSLLALLSATALAGLAVRGVLRRWESRVDPLVRSLRGPVARAHRRARRVVADRGWTLPASAPPVEAAQRLRALAPGPAAEALLELAWLYYATAFTDRKPRNAASRARQLARTVATLPERAAGPVAAERAPARRVTRRS